ncbi:MAG: mannose-1-phosphate guanylyltransferase [Planctomycetota bacterium]|jgi:mannose-1-phosphate guanylyltransferase
MNYAVIMAGGTGGHTLLYHCYHRLVEIFEKDNILVLTNTSYVDIVHENLPDLPKENIIAEPAVRDTASAIGLAATVLSKRDPDATMAVLSADHIIEPTENLQAALKDGLNCINKNHHCLMVFGIEPTTPSTQLGYIKCIDPIETESCINKVYTVEAFKEKPNENTAIEYVNAGNFFWNSGIFIWKANTILDYLQKFLPESTEPLKNIQAAWNTDKQSKVLQEWFPKLQKISIDFAVMEKAKDVHAIKLECKWLDMGSFNALAEIISSDEHDNVVTSELNELMDCTNTIVVTEEHNHLIAAIGVKDMVIAHSPDATLICPADQTHRLKELLEKIEKDTGEKFL